MSMDLLPTKFMYIAYIYICVCVITKNLSMRNHVAKDVTNKDFLFLVCKTSYQTIQEYQGWSFQ